MYNSLFDPEHDGQLEFKLNSYIRIIENMTVDEYPDLNDPHLANAYKRLVKACQDEIPCFNKYCELVQDLQPHFHCDYCNEALEFDMHNIHDVMNMPNKCPFCHHKVHYPKHLSKLGRAAHRVEDEHMERIEQQLIDDEVRKQQQEYEDAVKASLTDSDGYFESFTGLQSGYVNDAGYVDPDDPRNKALSDK